MAKDPSRSNPALTASNRHALWATRAYPSGTASCPSTGLRTAAVSKYWLRLAKPSTERKRSEAKLNATAMF